MEDKILYHGSKGGIKGAISPISRERCDFGKGFYMGSNLDQAKMIVCEKRDPFFYKLKLKLSEIPENKILRLEGMDWLYAILAERKLSDEFDKLKIAAHWRKKIAKYDVIIGKIADDKMLEVMERFNEFAITDNGLIKCLQSVNYGEQYVARTPFACSKIEILEEKKLCGMELQNAMHMSNEKRHKAIDIVNQIVKENRNNGLYLDQIVERERKKERSGCGYDT